MKPTVYTLKLLAALVAGGALLAAVPAHAGRDHGDRHHYDDDRGWRGEHRGRGHYKEKHKHRHERVVIKEKVIIKERPVVREYHYHEHPTYAAPVYARDPAIVIGVNVPPLVIPLP